MRRIVLGIGNIQFTPYAQSFSQSLQYSGSKLSLQMWMGILNITLVISLFFFSLIAYYLQLALYWYGIGFIVIAVLLTFIFYIWIFFLAERRTKSVENELPNALMLISANLRSGMTAFEALQKAALPEFGVLGDEIATATSRSYGSKDFSDYLLEIPTRVNSLPLHRMIRLFVSSLRSGGKLADLLEGLAADMTERRALKNDLEINIKTNLLFIMFIIIVGTPVLISIAIYFVATLTDIQSSMDMGSNAQGVTGFGGGQISITTDFLVYVAYGMLFFTGLFASFFIGNALHGEAFKGLKYAPIMVVGSYIVFIIAQYLIFRLLG